MGESEAKEENKIDRERKEERGRKWEEWIKKYEYIFCILCVGVDFGDVVVAALLGDVFFVCVYYYYSRMCYCIL